MDHSLDYSELMNEAISSVQEHRLEYGVVSDLFERACSIYNLITGEGFTPWQANMFMTSLKMASIKPNRSKADNYVEGINYLAFAGQFAQAKPGRVFVSAPTPLGPTDQVEDDIKRMAQMFAPVKKEDQE
jgi:hypothetical protein